MSVHSTQKVIEALRVKHDAMGVIVDEVATQVNELHGEIALLRRILFYSHWARTGCDQKSLKIEAGYSVWRCTSCGLDFANNSASHISEVMGRKCA